MYRALFTNKRALMQFDCNSNVIVITDSVITMAIVFDCNSKVIAITESVITITFELQSKTIAIVIAGCWNATYISFLKTFKHLCKPCKNPVKFLLVNHILEQTI